LFCAERFRVERIGKIGGKHIAAYVRFRRERGIPDRTIKNELAAYRFFWRYVEKNKLHTVPENKDLGLETARIGKTDRAWSGDEYRMMLSLAKNLGRTDVELALRLARNAGLRIHEITRLAKKDALEALAAGRLVVKGKGGRVREVPLSIKAASALAQACKRVKDEQEKLFVASGEKTHRVIKSIQDFIRNHRGGISETRITIHGLRHSYAREQYHSRIRGKDSDRWEKRKVKLEVSELLGHGRPEVTNVYLGPKTRS